MARIDDLLALDSGVERRLFLKIDGLEPILWQRSHRALPSVGYSRGGMVAFDPPDTEWSLGLDLGKKTVSPSSMTLGLRNIDSPTDSTKKFFADLFAPGKWSQSGSSYVRLARNSGVDRQLSASDTTIYCTPDPAAAGFPASGTAYIGGETFSYSGVSTWSGDTATGRFTGCVRGLHPCVGERFADTYLLSFGSTQAEIDDVIISTVPYSWVGRRVAVYVTAFDPHLQRYLNESDAILLWVGNISGEISYVPSEDVWKLQCDGILAQLDRNICSQMPKTHLAGINLNSSAQASTRLTFYQWRDGDLAGRLEVDISADVYSIGGNPKVLPDLIGELQTKTNALSWINNIGTPTPIPTVIDYNLSGDKVDISVKWYQDDDAEIQIEGVHILKALGFPAPTSERLSDSGSGTYRNMVFFAPDRAYESYHPTDYAENGGDIYLGDSRHLWNNQGDTASVAPALFNLAIDGIRSALDTSDDKDKFRYVIAADSLNTYTPGSEMYSANISQISGVDHVYLNQFSHGYAGSRIGDVPTEVIECYVPDAVSNAKVSTGTTKRGPYECILNAISSTGTPAYNGTYDLLPKECSLGIQACLIDHQSFLDADSLIINASGNLSTRANAIIEATAVSKMLHQEGSLFGVFVAWDRGKLRAKKLDGSLAGVFTETVNDTNSAQLVEYPDASWSTSTVVNHYKISVYDYTTGKKIKNPIEVIDERSRVSNKIDKTISIDHPGLPTWFFGSALSSSLDSFVKVTVVDNQSLLAFPNMIVRRTLKPSMINRIQIGDIVRYISNNCPDPYGNGTMSTDALAIVIDRSQSFTSYVGTCTMMLFSRYDAISVTPWAGAALIDRTAATGGWDNAGKHLTLVPTQYGLSGDQKDGFRFTDGDKINIIERSNSNPNSPQSWTNLEVDAVFETNGTDLLTLIAGTTLAGFDTTGDTEYVVVPADYNNVVASQKTTNAFLADGTTLLVGGDPPHRYG